MYKACPDTDVGILLKNWEAALRPSKISSGAWWPMRTAATERLVMNEIAQRTRNAVSVLKLSWRYASTLQGNRGVQLAAYHPTTGSTWQPTDMCARRMPCGFGCGLCYDGPAHGYECIRRLTLRGWKIDIGRVLVAMGLDQATAIAMSHHPRVALDLTKGRIPSLWREGLGGLLRSKKLAARGFIAMWLGWGR